MVSKNNVQERQRKDSDQKPHYAIKKLTIGVVSVLVGTTFAAYNSQASADTTASPANLTAQTNDVTPTGNSLTAGTATAGDDNANAAASPAGQSTATASDSSEASVGESQSSTPTSQTTSSTTPASASSTGSTTPVSNVPTADSVASGDTTTESAVSRQLTISVSYAGAANNPLQETRQLTFNGIQYQTTSDGTTTTTYTWQQNHASIQTTTPVVEGYVADASAVDQEVSLDEQGNLVVEVNGQTHLLTDLNPSFNTDVKYQKVGKVIPVAEDGTVIQTDANGAYVDAQTYQNDAADATKVTYTAPTIAGYITMQASDEGIHTPNSATEDTKIYYVPLKLGKTVTRTITYSGAGTHTPANATYSIVFTQTNARDEQTGGLTRTWDKERDSWPSVIVPAIDGYTPNVTEIAADDNVTYQTADQNISVIYSPNQQNGQVDFIDCDDQNQTIKTVAISGVSEGQIDFTAAATALSDLEQAGYALAVTNDWVDADGTFKTAEFDTDDNTAQTFKVYLVHQQATTTTDKTITRKITYTGAKDNPESVSQTAVFTETIVRDLQNGKTLQDTWKLKNNGFTAVGTPTIKGYTPNLKTVAAEDDSSISHTGSDQTIEVVYTPDDQKATVAFYVDKQNVYSLPLLGKTDQKIDLTVAQTMLNNFEQAGYTVLDGDLNADYTYDDEDDQDQTITVKLQQPTTSKTVHLTVNYSGAGDATPAAAERDIVFIGTISYDPATSTTKTDWVPQTTDAAVIATPVVDGLIASQAQITASPDQENQTATVSYAKIGVLQAVDEAGNVLATINYQNDPNDATKVGQTALPAVSGYVPKDGQQFVTPTDAIRDIQVVYLPIKAQFTQTITFTGAGAKTPTPQTQTIALTDSQTRGTFTFVVPKLTGYDVQITGAAQTVDQSNNILVTGATVAADSSNPASITVTYTPRQQTGEVLFVDDTDQEKQLATAELIGITDQSIDFSQAADQLAAHLKAGYALAATGNDCLDENGSFKAAVYGENNNFTVHLIHQTAVINSAADAQKLVLPSGVSLSAMDQQELLSENSYLDTTTASRTVNYAFSSNDATSQVPTATDQTQTVTFNRTNSYTVDLATGAVTKNNGDWQIAATPASDGNARLDAITPLTFAGWYLAISAVTDSLDAAATADDILKAHAVKPGQTQTLTLTYQKLAAATISILDEGINSGQSDKASLLNTYTVKGQQGADIDCDQVTEIVSVTTKDPDGKENTVTAESAANANAQLNAYLKAGYQLDQSLATIQNDNGTTTYTFKNGAVVTEKHGVYSFANQYDTDDTTIQNYQVYLVHGTTTATKNKTITRTINLHNVDQTTTITEQSCALTETIITDNVTGDTVSDTWNSGAWEAFEIPAVDGYVASENDLAQTNVYNTTSDQVVNVIYVPNSATATIKIIDDDAGNAELNEYQVSGTTAGQVNFNQAITQLKKYLTGNYTFNTANKNNSAKFTIAYRNGKLDSLSAADIYGATAQEYEIHLQHQKSISKEYADMTRTINLELPSGTKIVTQTVQISRAATTDLVTGSRSYGDWTTATWPEYAVPAVPGYQASRDVIVSETVTNTTPDKSINVVYTPIVQHANITIIDDTQNTTLAQADLTGTYGQAVDFDKPAISLDNVSPNGKLQEFLKNGYVLASQDNVASDNQHFATAVYGLQPLNIIVHLKEGTQATEETKTLTRTINYIVNGNVFKTVSQSAVLERTKTVNLVTGVTTYSEWTTGQWDKAVSPTHETDPSDIPANYYPDKSSVAEQTVLHATGNQIVLVYYSRPSDYRSATINIIDEDDGNVTLWTQETAGKTGYSVDFTSANAALSDYLNQGFVADSNRSLEHQAVNDNLTTFAQRTFADDSTQNVFTVYLKHGTKNLGDEKREVTRTINYVFPDGTTRTYVQAVDFKRTVTEDLVDERNIYSNWAFDSAQTTLSTTANGKTTDSKPDNVNQVAVFGKLDTAQVAKDANQDITGYVPSQAVVDELTGITEQTASQVVNITFSPKVESAVIGMIDTTVAADPKTGTNDFDFQSIYTNTASGYFGKSINVDLVNQYLNQFLNQNGYCLGVDTQTGTAKLINDVTTDNADLSQTETLTYTYTAGNTTAGQITETITTEPATVDNDGNTIIIKHYHFVMDSAASDVTATTTTTAAGNSSTVYQLDAKPFIDSMQTLVVPMLHYRTTANYSTSNPPAGTYKDVVRTIIYHLPDGTTETKTQIVRFTRSITTDHVTGMQTASSWSTGNDNYAWIETQLPDKTTTQSEVTRSSIWSSQSTPIVKGYTPTQKVVDEKQQVTAATPDSVIEISYQADKQAATIQIIDSTTGDVLSNYNVHGVTNEAINFDDANAQLNYYLTHGYLLANDTADHHNNDVQISDGQTSFKAVNYDNEDAQDQAFKVYLIHDEAKTDQAVDPNLTSITDTSGKQIDYVDNVKSNPKVTNPASYVQTVTSKRTAKFVFDGDSTTKPNISDCVQTVTWTRTVSYTIDLVTGKETPTYGEWKFVASTPNGKQVQTAINGGQAETTATTVTADEQEAGYVAAVSGSFAGWYQVNSDSATGKQTLPALANGQGLNQTVILEYKEYAKARIQIIDANPTENQGTLYDEPKADGQYKQGTSIDFANANSTLAELLSHGYVFDHASTNGNGTAVGTADGFTADTYDAKDNEDQNFIIYLRHDTAHATTQLTNDSRLTAASGHTAYLDSALKNTTLTNVNSYQESATSTRTVTFAFTSNTALPSAIAKVNGQTVTQVVTYTRPISYTVDLVTGTATRDYQTWQRDPKVMGTTSQGTTTTIDQNGQTTLSAATNFNDGIFPTVSGQIDGWYLASGDASAAQAPSPRTDQVGANQGEDLSNAEANVASSITLTFKKLQNAYIKIVDDNETDNQGTLYDESTSDANSKNLAQKQDTAIDFKTAQDKLNDLLKSGYVVDTEKTSALTGSTFTATNFDSDDTGDQIITVYLKHGTAIIGVNTDTKTSQATAGEKINPDSGNTVVWPDAVSYDKLTRQATQTIEYLYQGGGQAHENNVQTVVLTRTVTIDKVTGKVIKYSNFTTHKFDDVISPTIDNYRYVNSDDRVVVGKTASATFDEKGNETDSNLVVTYPVYYKTNGTWKKINEPVYDQDGQVRYRTDATGTSYLTEDDDASTVMATVPTYQGYTAVFETNQDSKTDQTLTPNKQTSIQTQVIKLQNDQAGQDSTVTYTPDPQQIVYRIYDQTLSKYISVADGDQLKKDATTGLLAVGVSDASAASQTTADKYQALKDALVKRGYKLVPADSLPAFFDHDDDNDQTVTITVVHDYAEFKDAQTALNAENNGTVTDTDNQQAVYLWKNSDYSKLSYTDTTTATRTIKFEFKGNAQSKPQVGEVDQTVTYTRPIVYTIDLVDGTITRDHNVWNLASAKTGPTTITMNSDGKITTEGASDNLGAATMPAVTGSFAGWYLSGNGVPALNADDAFLQPDRSKEGQAANQSTTVMLTYLHYQKATIQIIDDDQNDKQTLVNGYLTTGDGNLYTQVDLEGQQDTEIDFTVANALLEKLLAAGYQYESGMDKFAQAKFDSNDTVDQNFVVKLIHESITLDGKNQDQLPTVNNVISPGSLSQATWPKDVSSSNLTRQAERSIIYQYADGSSADNEQVKDIDDQVILTRTVTIDKVTGKVLKTGEFSTYDFEEKQNPVIAGYHTKNTSTAGFTAKAENNNLKNETTVYYYANGKYLDQRNGQQTAYTTGKDNAAKVSGTISVDPGYTAHIEQKQGTIDVPNSGTELITYTFTPDDPATDTTVTYTANPQTAIVQIIDDDANGKILNADAQNTDGQTLTGTSDATIDFSSINTELADLIKHGYLLNKASQANSANVDSEKVEFEDANYDHNDKATQVFTIHLIHDQADISEKPNYGHTIKDQAGQSVLYQPVKDKLADKAFSESCTAKRTISYTFIGDANSKPNAAGIVQTINFKRGLTYTVDLVTGEILATASGEWEFESGTSGDTKLTDATMPAVSTEFVGWYLVKSDNTEEKTLTPKAEETGSLQFKYYQKATIQIIDDMTNNTLFTQSFANQKQYDKVDFSNANDELSNLLAAGYILDPTKSSDGKAAGFTPAVYDSLDNTDQTFTIYLTHAKIEITVDSAKTVGAKINQKGDAVWPAEAGKDYLTKTVSQTINYVTSDGQSLAKSVVQTSTLTRTVTIDCVTGKKITETEFIDPATHENGHTFDKIQTPFVESYHVHDDSQKAGGLTATAEAPDREMMVTYYANGYVKAVDSTGKPFKDYQPVQYTTVKDDISKVESITIPTYAGYTAKINGQTVIQGSTYAIVDPDEDTVIVYTADAQKAQVQIFDDNVDPKTPLWTSAPDDLNGYTDTLIDFSNSQKQLDYYLRYGYQLAANGNNDLDGKRFKTAYYDNVNDVDQTFVAHLIHGKRTFNFGDSQPTGKMYSDVENSPAWPTMTLSEDATQTVKYTGAGNDTPGNKTQTAKDAFKRTATVDLVTGKVEYSTFSGNNVTFNPETTDAVPGYHVAESNKTAGGFMATAEKPNRDTTVTYLPNGSLRFTDQSQTLSSAQLQSIQYTTDAKDPSRVTVTIPLYSGYTAKIGDQIITNTNNQQEMTATTGAGSDMEVVYTADAQKAQVQIFDDDVDSKTPLWTSASDDLNGYTDALIDFSSSQKQLDYYLSHGYQLAANGNDDLDGTQFKTAYYDNVDDVEQTFVVHLVHGLKTVGVTDPYQAGKKIYADTDVTWPALTLTKDASQTIHYQGINGQNPADHVDQAAAVFTRTATIDLVTGAVTAYSKFTGQQTFEKNVATPVVPGYHVDENDQLAGGLTATSDDPTPETTVTYLPNGFLKALDASGQAMKGFVPVQYTTDQTNPSQVTVIIPTFAGYTATINGATVDQGIQYQIVNADRDTEVVYTANPQKLTVEFIDQTDHHDLAKVDLTGKTEQAVDFSEAAKKLSAYLTKYVLSDNNPGLDQGKFKAVAYDAVDTQDQIIKVYLEHGHEQVNETKDITQNITYVYQNADQQIAFGNAKKTKQAVRTGIRDLVTDQIVWSDKIEPIIFNSVDSPLLIGYQAQIKQVPAISVTVSNDNWAADLDQNIKVVYEPIAQTAIVSFVDQDDLKQTFPTITINGLSDQLIDFKAAQAQLQNYLASGYVLASDADLADAKYDRTDDPQFFTIYLKHGQQPDQRTKQVTETIKYVYADQTQAALPVVETITATQSGIKDLVTQQTDWNGKITFSADFTAVTSPLIEGYTPDQAVIEPSYPDDPDWNQLDIVKIVTYAADPQQLTFTIFDRTANTNLSVPNDLLTSIGISDHVLATGTSDAKLDQAAAARYQQLIKTVTEYFAAQAYGDVQSEQLPAVFDHDDTTDQNVVISLAHETGTVSHMVDQQKPTDDQGHQLPDSLDPLLYKEESFWDYPTSTRKISYNFQTNDANDVPQVQQAVQTVTYRRTVSYTVDLVTGQIVGEPIYGEPAYYTSSTTAVFAKQDHGSNVVQTSGANDSLGTNQIPGVTGEFNGWYEELADNNGTETVLFDGSRWYVEVAGQKQFVPADQLGKIVFKRYQKARTEIIDDDDNGKQLFIEDLIGKQQAAVDFQTAAAKLDELLSDGYQLANQAAAVPVSSKLLQRFGLMLFASLRVKTSSMGQKAFGSAAYDTDDTNVQVFTVHVMHQKETRQEAKTITRTINYHQPDGTVITVTQPATITRTVLFDKVTKQATPTTDWTMTAHAEQETPQINGYTPDKINVDEDIVDGTSQNSSVDVVYYRDQQKAIIDFVDDDRGQTLSTVTVDGKLNDSIDFSLANQALESYRNHGYQLAFGGNDDLNDAQTAFKAAKYHAVNGVQNYVVHLTHVWQDATEDKTIIRTINYHLPDGTLKTITQPATINRSVKIDKAVGTKICGKWSQASWPAIEVPSLAGYSPSQAAIVAETVDETTADKTVDVFYQGHEQAASVRIIDLTTGKPLTEEKLHGLSGEPLDFAKINAELTAYLSAGYTLASNNQAIDDLAMKSADFDSDDQSDQVFVVYLTHRINEVPETQTVTRVIKYRQPDGSVKTVQETQLSKRLLRIDAVTGQKVASGDWTPISWPEIVPPIFKGYTATVSQNIPQNDGTVLVEVSYQAELKDDHNHEQDDHDQDADKHDSQTIHQFDQSDLHSVDSAAVSPSIPRTDKPAGMANKPTGKQTDHSNNQRLVQTGNQATGKQTVLGGLLLGLAGMLSGLGLKRKKRGDK
ncbi:mucin-binding protein [Limosilactobacillus mucosae]|uniref:mucin-binding protein n=1 Tax=Limosilactobacillus mucosae TaxID=97478 RepID=UPI00233EF1D9|nr:YSIRK-type signal peptide-containing protein [Limosilactobacillus mucosae]MDC2840955.1 YSIRK-type signal peptide-containing protein [Limosilactobacillus mucosae]